MSDNGDYLYLHVLTPSSPTRRSTTLPYTSRHTPRSRLRPQQSRHLSHQRRRWTLPSPPPPSTRRSSRPHRLRSPSIQCRSPACHPPHSLRPVGSSCQPHSSRHSPRSRLRPQQSCHLPHQRRRWTLPPPPPP